VLRRTNPRPRLDWADRAVLAAPTRVLPTWLRAHRSRVAPLFAGTAALLSRKWTYPRRDHHAAPGTPAHPAAGLPWPARYRCYRASPTAPARSDNTVQLQGPANRHPRTGTGTRREPERDCHRSRLPAYIARLEADRDETDRPGPRIVLVRDGSLQPHGDQAQAGAQLRYAIGHDQSEPAMGPGNRMAAASTKHWRP
jgi:hypothetical protein